jgi:hypothetical protein
VEATGRLGKNMTLPKETGGWPFLRDQLGGCLRRPKRRLSFARVEIGWLTAERRSFNLALAAVEQVLRLVRCLTRLRCHELAIRKNSQRIIAALRQLLLHLLESWLHFKSSC